VLPPADDARCGNGSTDESRFGAVDRCGARGAGPDVGLTRAEPDLRWSLKRAEEYLLAVDDGSLEPAPPAVGAARLPLGAVDRLLADGLTDLRRGMSPNGLTLWPPRADARDHDGGNLWTGAAGGLATPPRRAADRRRLASGLGCPGDQRLAAVRIC
jgi:hypothetical protein